MADRRLTLLVGGAGAGKSSLAVRLAEAAAGESGRVLFVATAQAGDAEMTSRIKRHQSTRPRHWRVVEEPYELPEAVDTHAAEGDIVVIDCLTMWVSNLLLRHEGDPLVNDRVLGETRHLLEVWESGSRPWIVVSNEVGMGVVPPYPLGRAYRDLLGEVNQMAAARATEAYLVVAGLTIELKHLRTTADIKDARRNLPSPRREGSGG